MRKRVKIEPIPLEKAIISRSSSPPPVGPSSYGSAPFSPSSYSDTSDYVETKESAEEALIDFDSKLVLNYADPPMTPPAEALLYYSGHASEVGKPDKSESRKSPLQYSNSNNEIHTDADEPDIFNDFDSCLNLGRIVPAELWIHVFSYLPPKTMSRIMKSCCLFSNLAFDQVYWKTACLNAGVDCRLVLQQAKKDGVCLDGFSLSSEQRSKSETGVNVAEYLSISKLEIQDAAHEDQSVPPSAAATGCKRRLNDLTLINTVTELLPVQPRQRRKIAVLQEQKLEEPSNSSSPNWWTYSSQFYPKTVHPLAQHQHHRSSKLTTTTTSLEFKKHAQPKCDLLSWYHVYTCQFKTRSTFLQSPYTFRRQTASHKHGITCLETTTTSLSGQDSSELIVTGSWDGTLKIWKLVYSPKMSESAKEMLDGLCWDEIIRGRKRSNAGLGYDSDNEDGEDEETNEDDGDEEATVGAEDSVWLSGVENDTMGIGELVDHVHGEIQNMVDDVDEGGSSSSSYGISAGKSWIGAGKYELELVKSIDSPYPIECMSIDGTHLVTGGRGPNPLTLWSLSPYPQIIRQLTSKPFLQPPYQHTSSHITCIHVSFPLIATSQKQLLQVWHLPTGTLLAAISKKTDSNTSCIKIVQDTSTKNQPSWWILEACAFGSISVWKFNREITNFVSPQAKTDLSMHHSVKVKPIPDAQRNLLEEPRQFECTVYGHVEFIGSFETIGGINSAQIRETGAENQWDLLCGFKDGNIRGWNVTLKREIEDGRDNVVENVDADGYSRNRIDITGTGSLCSLGDWITWLNEDFIADVVIAGAWDGRIRVWDKRKKALRRSLVSDIRSAVLCLKTIGDVLIAGSYNGSLVVYDFSKQAK
ncbi:UNVERIFIED_CONTAM: hypothetical protein HDU68_004217 [Siphonaria sp. JEL0065]|nr:hypothetical protein HDU68_004217 [Siphonaria sp. JEL0065]